jgi:fatty-acyl-CoA synthase
MSDPMGDPTGTLWDAVAASAERTPGKAAIRFLGASLSYAELVRQAEALSGVLQRRCGVQRGDRVLLFAQNCPQFVIATCAVHRADAAVVPLNVMWTAAEVQQALDDSGARIAIVAEELFERLRPRLADGTLAHTIVIRYADALTLPALAPAETPPPWMAAPPLALDDARCLRWHEVLAAGLPPGPHRAGADDLAVLPYTSGTTGRPKGCIHTHATVQSANRASAAWRGLDAGLVTLAVAPLFHGLGMQNGMHLPLMLGGTVVMLPRWDRDAALRAIEAWRVTHWGAPPAMLIDFFANPALERHDISSLKLVFGGSATMPEAVAERLKQRYGLEYNEGYGLTETASFLQANPVGRGKRASLGIPGPGVRTLIVEPGSDRVLPTGEVGEIVTHGPQVMKGYWQRPDADREAFVEIGGRRFFRTGDLGIVDDEGYFFIKDRLKRMVSVSGYKVWPAEVEAALYAHPAVHEACVIAVPDAKQGEAVKALVALKPGAALTDAELVAWARERMAVYKAPRFVEFVAELPKSATGKILWRELQEEQRRLARREEQQT